MKRRIAAKVFLSAGVLALSWCVVILVEAHFSQERAGRYLESVESGSIAPAAVPAAQGEPIGKIEIPRVGIASVVFEGTDDATLKKGVGHIDETPGPGGAGNVGLAGHRDTIFRGLKDIHIEDEIVLTTLAGVLRYRVDSTQIVEPESVDVLDDRGRPTLTLVTCYPFYYVGSAPHRFIVWAHLVDSQ